MAETFEDLRVWQTARTLTNAVYEHTKTGAFSKDFGLRDQIQRATVSIMSNIAEGFESRTRSQFIHYLGQAKASAGEVRCQLYVANDQDYLSETEFEELYDHAEKVARQLYRLIQHLDDGDNTSRVRELPSKYSA
ncbi:four helix bundle protein [Salinibacter ruber]|uniref:four helix bundle protein n=1 Tax=Salinibacter ruber TaxID=146919 RepID=UPI00216A4CFC|nr:four helix bundle protein [Salinibacter ruber]